MFHVTSSALIGIKAAPIIVEADISRGLRSFTIVGLPDAAVKESRDRIRSAIKNSGFVFPRGRVTINLAPANIKKQGPIYDLPIALSILLANGEISNEKIGNCVIAGELSLNGNVRKIRGVLPIALMAVKQKLKTIYIPENNKHEATNLDDLETIPVKNLKSIVEHLNNITVIEPSTLNTSIENINKYDFDFCDVKGQLLAKRGLEIAAAGMHNILLKGPPGTGKTLLAKSLPSILPNLSVPESIEVSCIKSVSNCEHDAKLDTKRPFRNPHHSSSAAALVGGGTWPQPGEISLAHRGVLFLDELPEFSRYVLEHLRQPLEDGFVNISRVTGSYTFPAQFLLIASMNPCPCGYLNDPKSACMCTYAQINKYKKKISGPLLDRFDIVIEVPNLLSKNLTNNKTPEPSVAIRNRVCKAFEKQKKRFNKTSINTNNDIPPGKISTYCNMSEYAEQILHAAFEKQKLSARGYFKIQKVARTIADLDNAEIIETQHIAEALQFRP